MGEISFTKMQGAGNDFILVREEDLPRGLGSEIGDLARKICDRRFGVGADGLMVASCKRDGIQMRYCNADGSPAAVCGNGLRCFARYASEQQLVKEDRFVVQTDAGAKAVELLRDAAGAICGAQVEIGRPELLPYEIPALLPGSRIIDSPLNVSGLSLRVSCLKVGVPHAVVFWEQSPTEKQLCGIGRAVEHHPAFPEGINFDIAVPAGKDTFRIFTWERGAGHTLACGTGCCAAAAAVRLSKRSDAAQIRLIAEGGTLTVKIEEDGNLLLSGGAQKICSGTFLF